MSFGLHSRIVAGNARCSSLAVVILLLAAASTAVAGSLPGLNLGANKTLSKSVVMAPAPAPLLAAPGNPGVLPPWSSPFGASYGEWGARWWRWILSVPAGGNPLVGDATAFCDAGQSGPVWFLVGQNGSHACTVPSGRGIFFPIINLYLNAPCAFPECAAELTPAACAANPAACTACLQSLADDFLGSVTEMHVELDGVALSNLFNYRGGSGVFSFAADPSLHFIDGCLTDEPQPFLTDGYWLMLAPLRVGTHSLHFSASSTFLGSPFTIDVSYALTVAPGGRGRGQLAGASESSLPWGVIKQLYK